MFLSKKNIRQSNVAAAVMMHQPHRGVLNAPNTFATVVFKHINVLKSPRTTQLNQKRKH